MRDLFFKTFSADWPYPRTGPLVFILVLLLSLGLGTLPLEAAEGKDQTVLVKVNGLSCPFCAYGVEKKLKALDGVKDIHVRMNEGEVIITFEVGTKIDVEAIKQAVEDSGFTAREVILPGVVPSKSNS